MQQTYLHSKADKYAQRAFATALEPLKRLAHLGIGVLLSDEDVLHRHIPHVISSVVSSKSQESAHNAVDCECLTDTLSSQAHSREHQATQIITSKLSSIRTLSFCSLFPLPSSPCRLPQKHLLHVDVDTVGFVGWNTYCVECIQGRGKGLMMRPSQDKSGNRWKAGGEAARTGQGSRQTSLKRRTGSAGRNAA